MEYCDKLWKLLIDEKIKSEISKIKDEVKIHFNISIKRGRGRDGIIRISI